VIPVFDSNIVIDALNGSGNADSEFSRYKKCAISLVTWIEVMAGIHDVSKQSAANDFLYSKFVVHGIDNDIAAIAADLRRKQRSLKLPDAIIWATAMQQNTLLVTRNSKDFPKNDPTIRIPYVLRAH